MPEASLRIRLWITAALLAGATIVLHAASHPIRMPVRHPLKELPFSLGEWQGTDIPLTAHILEAAGVDDYLNRSYADQDGNSVEVYVGYYSSQRSGDLIHSPRNCLPAAGWESVHKGRLSVPLPAHAPIVVNDFRIAKGRYQDVVLYWYQGRGRAIADEYQAKLWMIADAAMRRRNDGSLVRIVVPVQGSESTARELGVKFLRVFYPRLSEFIPD
jgi:EpsI family protein